MTCESRPPVWRISTVGFSVKGAFNKLKKTREMFWSGRRDLNSGPPAPNAGAIRQGLSRLQAYLNAAVWFVNDCRSLVLGLSSYREHKRTAPVSDEYRSTVCAGRTNPPQSLFHRRR